MPRLNRWGKRADRVTLHENEIIVGECARVSWVYDFYPSGHVRVATFGRLNMTSNARCGRRVA